MRSPRFATKATLIALARSAGADLALCVGFYTRLPSPKLGHDRSAQDFGRALGAAPLAGALVGAIGGASVALAAALGLPLSVQALLALAAMIAVTGSLHEDGLADVADGFGGGRTRERKLDIMRDSRIGTYGALALVISVALRASALAATAGRFGTFGAACALVAGEAASRGFGLLPLAMLKPARSDGLGRAAGQVPGLALLTALFLSLAFGLTFPAAAGVPVPRAALACLLSLAAAGAMAGLARRQIGGFTGDVAGAAQQAASIAFLLGLLIGPGFA